MATILKQKEKITPVDRPSSTHKRFCLVLIIVFFPFPPLLSPPLTTRSGIPVRAHYSTFVVHSASSSSSSSALPTATTGYYYNTKRTCAHAYLTRPRKRFFSKFFFPPLVTCTTTAADYVARAPYIARPPFRYKQ